MKYRLWILFAFSTLLAGCAAYKELEPVPEISFLENGYIELQDDDEFFELSEGDKYFIRFPQPLRENTYLVLTFNDQTALTTYLTRAFDDGEGSVIKMKDESEDPKTTSVYLLDRTVPTYYWVIENVRSDYVLNMTYRYVAVWRYKFEQKRNAFRDILTRNTHPRELLNAIGVSKKLSAVELKQEKGLLETESSNIEQVGRQMGEIEAIFPPDIINSQDQAYKDYLTLKQDIAAELAFQNSYRKLLDPLAVLGSPKPELNEFSRYIPDYNNLFRQPDMYPGGLYTAAKTEIGRILPLLAPHYEQLLRKKTTVTPVEINVPEIRALYEASGVTPNADMQELTRFVELYNQRANAFADIRSQLNSLNSALEAASTWPMESFYAQKRAEVSKMLYNIPASDMESYGKYKSYACAALLSKSIAGLNRDLRDMDEKMRRAELLIPQINVLRNQGNYSEILRLLKENQDLTFLRAQYAELDEMSLAQQRKAVSMALRIQDFTSAENALRRLEQDRNFINPDNILPRKKKLVRAYEDSIQVAVENLSVNNANSFIEANKLRVDPVDSLYRNPALYPAHTFAFSASGTAEQKNQTLVNRMNFLRQEKFPETAIEALYRSMVDAPHEQGVEKARAIVVHGQHYTGNSGKIKNLVAECDPTASKWLTEAKQYRKIYALPISTNRGGANTYMIKLNLRIPSDANFPVYDVNVKLPQEVARHAGSKQWYDTITFNKKVLKNEGRFNITAPDPENDYIAQITPLQVNKTGDNVLEIRFNYNAYKVLEVSVMAQKPIIKKN